MTRRPRGHDAAAANQTEDDIVRSTLDDHTVAVLREAALQRGVSVDQLIADLLRAASTRVDEILDNGPT